MGELFREGAPLDKNRGAEVLTPFKRQVADALNDPIVQQLLLQGFKEYLVQYLALNQAPIPISQIFGFNQFTVNPATTITTEQSTSSTSYVDLTTAGPSLTGLADGGYMVWFGASMRNSGAGGSYASLSANGAVPADDNGLITGITSEAMLSRAIAVTLDAGGNNSVKVQYRASAGTATFNRRWLLALKYQN